MDACGVTRAASSFRHPMGITCLDRHPSNMCVENSIAADRGDWPSLNIACEIHMVGTVHSKVFGLVEKHVKGLIHSSLSVNVGAAMTTFRRCVKQEVQNRVDILHGPLPPETMLYRETVA
eukprot:6142581-Pyramimonas_sp.AAC.1